MGRSLRDFANGGNGNGHRRDDDSEERDAAYADAYSSTERDAYDRDDSAYLDAYPADETGYSEAYSARDRALVPVGDEGEYLPARIHDEEVAPVIIPGTGESMGNPFIARRERPLTMRIAVLTLVASIVVTGLFAVTPLGSNAEAGASSFQALSGVVLWRKDAGYTWYVVKFGDTVDSIAQAFHVEIGGIYKLNDLLIGQELGIGKAYKIPEDPSYGAGFRPASLIDLSGGSSGATTFGNSPWTSFAGRPNPEALCGPNGAGNPLSYQLKSPNWGAYWVRGFTWYHNGVDLATTAGNPIHAAQAGQVIWTGWDFGGLGWSVKINHCNGLSTVYGHMMQLNVATGQNIQVGTVVGLEGSTGFSTGPHLHFMVEVNNSPVDPMAYYKYDTYAITHP